MALFHVLGVGSFHIIAGHCIHMQSSRNNNIVGLIADLKLLIRALEVIGDESHNHELGIFTRCMIECEGLEGTTKSPEGSIFFASWFVTGKNYVICIVKSRVK